MHIAYPANRRFALRPVMRCLVGAAALSWAASAAALGLGELALHSGLNQPFNADIDLIDTAGLGPEDLRVSLASAEAFDKAGVERTFFLSDLRFTPVTQSGRTFIHVQSSKAVVEPFLSFLVQVDRPGGQVLRGYTLLIDPPGSVALAPARVPTGGTRPHAAAEPAVAAAAPVAQAPLPPASEGKRYVVEKGDTLWTIGKKLQAAGTPTPPNQLVRDIRALNPQRAPLKAGQSLLLPDTAVLPDEAPAPPANETPAAAAAPPVAPAPAPAPVAAPDMAASVLNQQLQQNLDALQAKVKDLEGQVADKNQQVNTLQGQLANRPTAAAPAPTPTPAAAPPKVQTAAPVVEDNSWMYQVAALVLVLLLLVALWLRRRQAGKAPLPAEPAIEEPALAAGAPRATFPAAGALAAGAPVAPALASYAAPALLAAVAGEGPARKAAPATDALDGASIYIAYGRFNEALGILREGLRREPGREDLSLKILEVLAQQGDAQAYAAEEAAMRAQGMPERGMEQVRERFPKMALALAATAAAAAAATPTHAEPAPAEVDDEAFIEALEELDEPELLADAAGASDDDLDALDLSDLPSLDDLDSLAPGDELAQTEPEPAAASNEFNLSLDDLSLDADWASVDPFDSPKLPSASDVAEPAAAEPAVADFGTNLNELPEVLELSEEHYLGELAEVGAEAEVEKVNEFDASALGFDFGDTFDAPVSGDELPALPELDDLPELEALSLDFEAIDTQQQGAEKLEQARRLLTQGDNEQASRLLYALLREGDAASREQARTLLARLGQ